MIVPPTISAKSYRKTLIVIQLFRRILPLSSSSSVSLSDLTATVVASFATLTGSTEREVECTVDSIHHDFSTLITYKVAGSSIPLVNQRWYRI